MREERMKILAMVESGKITVDDAERLFDALYLSRRLAVEQGFNDFADSVSGVARNISDKVSEGVKAATPKVVEITKTVVSKTAEAAENISKAVRDWSENHQEGGCDCGCEGEHKEDDHKEDDEHHEN